MEIWAIANHKGGVGRTTTALMLARTLALHRRPVLLVDLDPIGSLTRAFGFPLSPPEPDGAHDIFMRDPGHIIAKAHATTIAGIHLLPSHPALATLERRAGTQPGLGMALVRALHLARQKYPYVVVDCPAGAGMLTVNSLIAADRLIIPTLTDPLSLHGVTDTYRTAAMIQHGSRRALRRTVLTTMHDRRTQAGIQNASRIRGEYGSDVWPGSIPVDTRLRDPQWITDAAPLHGRGPQAYQHALGWIMR